MRNAKLLLDHHSSVRIAETMFYAAKLALRRPAL